MTPFTCAAMCVCSGGQQKLTFEKCLSLVSGGRPGGGLLSVSVSTRRGLQRARGGWPVANSMRVMPRDQMSAALLYLHTASTAHSTIHHISALVAGTHTPVCAERVLC